MNALLLASLFLAAPQVEEKFIPRVSKDVYLQAVRDLNKAVELITDDPQGAIERTTTILTSSRIKHFECRLKIEVQPQVPEYHDFFPYQVRGRARLAWGKKAALDASVGILTSAMEDLKASMDKKVPGSEESYKEAEELLGKKKKEIEVRDREKDNPFTKFKPKYDEFINSDRYKSALAYVTGSPEGQKLTEEERKTLADDVERMCADFRDTKLAKFRNALIDATASSLVQGGESGFRNFSQNVPPDTELTEKAAQNPVLLWARKHLKTLKSIQANQAKVDEVLASASEALTLDPPDFEGENPHFKGMALLGSELCQKSITQSTDKASGAAKAERTRLQAAADGVHAQWKAFADGLDKKVLERHPDVTTCTERLAEFVKAFPIELAQLAQFDIDAAFTSDPGPSFTKIENGLLELESNLPGKVAIESRQELYTKLITAAALRRMIGGDSEDKIVNELRPFRSKLRDAGVQTSNGEKYGPRVKKVFERVLM
jgi:hypothetical protein